MPTDLNPADIASRGVLPDMVDQAGIWVSGPQFLYDCASGWPSQPDFLRELHDDDPEIKPARASMAQMPLETKDCLNRLFERNSDLRSSLLSVCWMLRFKQYLKWNCTRNTAAPHASPITVEQIENATVEVIKILQRQAFPDDLSALTPNMILTGVTYENAPPDVFMKSDVYRRSWRKTQLLADEFWRRWMLEYLPLLQPRQKWFATSPNLKPGDLVLVMNDQRKRGAWPKAVIEEVFPDKAGLVRRVKVRTADAKTLLRDVRKICLLESHAKNYLM